MHRLATIPADPAAPMFHRFRSEAGEHLLVVPYSRVFDLSADLARAFDQSGADQATFVDALAARAWRGSAERRGHACAAEHFA
jgi:hypothetical protein